MSSEKTQRNRWRFNLQVEVRTKQPISELTALMFVCEVESLLKPGVTPFSGQRELVFFVPQRIKKEVKKGGMKNEKSAVKN